MKLDFLNRFSKNTQILNFMKIRPVTSEVFHADRRTESWAGGRRDVTELILTVSNLAKVLNIGTFKC